MGDGGSILGKRSVCLHTLRVGVRSLHSRWSPGSRPADFGARSTYVCCTSQEKAQTAITFGSVSLSLTCP